MAHLSRWLVGEGLDACDLCSSQVERFLVTRRAAGYACHFSEKAMRPVLAYLRDLGVAPVESPPLPSGAVEVMLGSFRHYLIAERGLRASTVRGYADAVRPFLRGRLLPGGQRLNLRDLSGADVIAFVVATCPHQSSGLAKMTVTALRSLLGFLHVGGMTDRSLSEAVPSVAGWRLSGLPKGLSSTAVQRLLGSCDRRTRSGRRAFGILTLLARLGLRSGEVAALQLDDIDWRAGEIVVRGKGDCAERLPLPSDVGRAIAAYLGRGRPSSAQGRTVFVRIKAPHHALTSGGVTQVVVAAAQRAGIGRIHAHRLRHTVATQLLSAGAPLSEISQLLRHHRALTTAIYAKVDRDALRIVARPWPGGVE